MAKIKILIIEDEPLIAEDLSAYVEDMGHQVIAIAYDSETALDYIAIHQPDLILLDITIDGSKNGLEVGAIIHDKYKTPFIYITSHSDHLTLDAAKKTMPYGFIVKPFSERDLFSTIEIALFRFDTEIKSTQLTLKKVNTIAQQNITETEFDILLDLKEGLRNQEIADKHFISINTVKTHLKKIYQKLNVHNRTSAIAKIS